MARTIYEIDDDIASCVDQETGEIVDVEKLDDLNMERERKIEGALLWAKNEGAMAKALDAEIKNLQARKKTCQKNVDGIKRWAINAIGDSKKFKTAKVAATVRKSPASVVVDDITEIPSIYLVPQEPKPDKKAIGDAIKRGEFILGAHIEDWNQFVVIK